MPSEKQIAANQRNAQRSTGPKTEAGKERSRGNALKHGLSGAGTVLKRNDDRKFRKALVAWRAHLQPIDVLEDCLVKRAALAHVRLERCLEKDLASVARRRRRAKARWSERQEALVMERADLLEHDPRRAVVEIESSSMGCGWMIVEWKELAAALDEPGFWHEAQVAHAIRLLGKDPNTNPATDALLTKIQLAFLAALPDPDFDAVDAFFEINTKELDPESRIEALSKRLPTRETGRLMLLAIAESEIERLKPLRAEIWTERDAPRRKECEDISLVDTSTTGARSLRYETAHEMSLHRNLNQLIRLRKIEPEQQTYNRLEKMGITQGRRWGGTGWINFGTEGAEGTREEFADGVSEARDTATSAAPLDESVQAAERTADEGAPDALGTGESVPMAQVPLLRNEPIYSESSEDGQMVYDDRVAGSPTVEQAECECATRAGSTVGSPVPAKTLDQTPARTPDEARDRRTSGHAALNSPVRNEANYSDSNNNGDSIYGNREPGSPTIARSGSESVGARPSVNGHCGPGNTPAQLTADVQSGSGST